MNFSEQYFQDTIKANHPAKWLNVEYSPTNGLKTIFVLDTNAECRLDFGHRFRLASHVWEHGKVIKDRDGIFFPVCGPNKTPANYNYQVGHSANALGSGGSGGVGGEAYAYVVDWYFPAAGNGQTKLNKCTCGTHAVGSNSHSSWCDIKGMK